ncbi:hypothetical protein Tco_0656569 [Tanacetum coccineum]|uniref:Uncharacterized protein n=1 Tax=Tanacetum coccineum TaxID=301880 RepID=A0ABQ4X943_9ASTR
MVEDTTADVQVLSCDVEGSSDVIMFLQLNLRHSCGNLLMKTDRPLRKPALTISISNDLSHARHINWASALKSTYEPPQENSLICSNRDMAAHFGTAFVKQGLSELTPQDLEGLHSKSSKCFIMTACLVIYKDEGGIFPDVGLEQLVPVSVSGVRECCKSLEPHFRPKDKRFSLHWSTYGPENLHCFDSNMVNTSHRLPKGGTFETDSGFLHLSWRFNLKYQVQRWLSATRLMMRWIRVKEFQINRFNPGIEQPILDGRKDVDWSKDFMFDYPEKALKTRRIFLNLGVLCGWKDTRGD